ncbi:MAG: 3-dehydroquinate synthase family protein, partial [Bacteroidota bacterium]
ILVDNNTQKHCLPIVMGLMPHPENVSHMSIPAGEAYKSITSCERLWEELSEKGADRNSLLINLGGGVICDLGGFVASTFKRGIRFINIPTTLLSQVDAAIGGKVGVDLAVIKNQIGLFAHPLGIYINLSFLDTLDEREKRSGFAEMIKIALIADKALWEDFIRIGYPASLTDANLISRVINIKENITESDLYERGPRKTLNYGHTTGHALESWFLSPERERILHGEAVAAGMLIESWLSARLGGLSDHEFSEIDQFLCDIFPMIQLTDIDLKGIINGMVHDKKNRMGRNNFTLLEGIGHAITDNFPGPELIQESLEWYQKLGSGG